MHLKAKTKKDKNTKKYHHFCLIAEEKGRK